VVAPWDRRSATDQRRLEGEALAGWLPLVLTAAPFHADRAGDLDQRLLTDRRGLQRLAPTRELDLLADAVAGASTVLRPTEAQVKAAGGDLVIRKVARGIRRDGAQGKRDAILQAFRPVQLHRGGIQGELLVASSRTDLDLLHRTGARAASVLGLRDDDVLVSAVPAGPTLDHLGVVHLAAGAGLTALHARGHGDDLEAVVQGVAQLPPSVLVVPLEEAAALAEVAGEAGADLGRLRTVVVVGPPPDDAEREGLTAAYGELAGDVAVRALYGPGAGRTLWAECAEGVHGLHTYPDLEVLEVLDPLTGTPADAHGDLTVTSVGWHGSALVRFQTGVWVDPLSVGECPGCGRTVPRIVGEVTPHAWELPVATGAGHEGAVDLRGVGVVAAATPGVTDWRVEVQSPAEGSSADRVLVEFAGGLQADRERLERQLEVATGVAPELTVGLSAAQVREGAATAGGVLADRR
jgi:hypothetical protein